MKFGDKAGVELELPVAYLCKKCGKDSFYQMQIGKACECGGVVEAKFATFNGIAMFDMMPEEAKRLEEIFGNLSKSDETTLEDSRSALESAIKSSVSGNNGEVPCVEKMTGSTMMRVLGFLNDNATLTVNNQETQTGGEI